MNTVFICQWDIIFTTCLNFCIAFMYAFHMISLHIHAPSIVGQSQFLTATVSLYHAYTYRYNGIKCVCLAHNQLEMHGCVLSTVTTGWHALMLKHWAIGVQSAESIFFVLALFHTEILYLHGTIWENKITFWKKLSSCLTNCGLAMPYGDTQLDQLWLR